MNNTNYIPLNSVGCFIEEVTGITYPMNEDGTPDLMSDVFIEDCTEEWYFSYHQRTTRWYKIYEWNLVHIQQKIKVGTHEHKRKDVPH